MVFAVQLYELAPEGWTRSLIHFALQARGRWFEPSCAHKAKQPGDGYADQALSDYLSDYGAESALGGKIRSMASAPAEPDHGP